MHNPHFFAGLAFSLLVVNGALVSPAMAAQDDTLPVGEIWSAVQDNSLTLQRAEQALADAEEALGIQPWDNSDIGLSSSTRMDMTGNAQTSTAVTLDLSVPVTSKATLGAELGSDETFSLSGSYRPFNSALITPQMELTYQQALINLDEAQSDLYQQLETAVFSLMTAQSEQQLAEENWQIAQAETDVVQANVNAGTATNSELLDAQIDESEAQQAFYSARVTLAEAQQALDQLTGTPQTNAPAVTSDDLSRWITLRTQNIAAADGQPPASAELKQLEAELMALQTEADDIQWYESDLTFSAQYDVAKESVLAGISIDLSPSQFRSNDILDAELEVTLKQMEIDSEQAALDSEYRLAKERIDIRLSALEAARATLVQRQVTLDETQYLMQLGEQTELELRQAQYSYAQADNQLLGALVALYQAQTDLLALLD